MLKRAMKRPLGFGRLALPVLRRGRAFARNEDGVTAIEFAFLAIPFFTIIIAIMQTAVIFLASQILDSAVQDTSRLVRTGRAQTLTEESFRNLLCDRLYGMFDCTSGESERLRVNVSVVDSFTSAEIPYPVATGEACTPAGCDWVLESGFDPGTGGQAQPDVILVRAYYKWKSVVSFPGFEFGTLPDGSRLMGAARVFMNEPF
jgi:Flp pilus assembly protein TadG